MKNEALLVIDMLNDFVLPVAPLEVPETRSVIKNIRREEWGSVTVSELAVLPGEKGEVTLED